MPLLDYLYNAFADQPLQRGDDGQITTPGFVPGLLNSMGNNSNALMQVGLGLMSGRDNREAFANAAQGLATGSQLDERAQLMGRQQAKDAALRRAAGELAKDPSMAPYAAMLQANPELAGEFAKAKFAASFKDNSPLVVAPGSSVITRDGKTLFQAPVKDDAPSDWREYQLSMKQRIAQGEDPATLPNYDTWSLDRRRAGAQQIQVGSGEKTYDQKLGGDYAERFLGIQKDANGARAKLGTLATMEDLAKTPGFYSGTGAQTQLAIRKGMAALGLTDPNSVASMENFRSLASKATIDGLGSLGTGVSNADRDFIQAINPGLDTSEQGNKNLITILRRVEERKLQVARLARDYAKQNGGRLDYGFEDVLDKWSQQNPLFSDEERKSMAAGRGAVSGGSVLDNADAIVGIGR